MSKSQSRFYVYKICTIALLTAMMTLLALTLSIQTPYFKLSPKFLPIVLASMLFGPLEGTVVAVLGELAAQMMGPYGLSPTTVIWIFPPACYALAVGGAALWARKGGMRLENRPVLCYVCCILGGLLTTTSNTVGMWLDSLVYNTSFAAAAFWVPSRIVSGVSTAIVIATVCIPVMRGLCRSGMLKYTI